MATAWTFEGETARLGGPEDTVTLVEETTFCLSDRCGDVRSGGSHGLMFPFDASGAAAFAGIRAPAVGTRPHGGGCRLAGRRGRPIATERGDLCPTCPVGCLTQLSPGASPWARTTCAFPGNPASAPDIGRQSV